MSKWFGAFALCTVLFVAVSCATPEPTVAPTDVPAPDAEAQMGPTEVIAEVVGESGLTMSEVEQMAADGLTDDQLALWLLEYTLPDGTVVVPAAPRMEGSPNLAVVTDLSADGDWNADETMDEAVLLVDSSNPDEPQLHLAAVIDQDGMLVNSGMIALPPGHGVSSLSFEDGKLVLVAQASAVQAAWQKFVFEYVDGELSQSGDPSDVPAPEPLPTDAPQLPAPPIVGITFDPQAIYTAPGESVDIYVHAGAGPGIVKLEWYLNNEKQAEKIAPDGEGVPFTHQTFAWPTATVGTHYIFATATDRFGQVATSQIYRYTVTEVQ